MSASCDVSSSCPIPSRASHRQRWSSLPDSYSQTPGGTVFSTTPWRDQNSLRSEVSPGMPHSPIAKTPPCCLPHIPGVTMPSAQPTDKLTGRDEDRKDLHADDNQFVLDI